MMFNKKRRFRKNFLVIYVSSFIKRLYKDYEYEIYNEAARQLTDEDVVSGRKKVDTDVICKKAIKHFREEVCDAVIEYVGKEYPDFIPNVEEFIDNLYKQNYEDIRSTGPTVDIVYSIAAKMIMGEEYEFRFIEPVPDNAAEYANMDEFQLVGVMITRLQQTEEKTILTSIELLEEDKLM